MDIILSIAKLLPFVNSLGVYLLDCTFSMHFVLNDETSVGTDRINSSFMLPNFCRQYIILIARVRVYGKIFYEHAKYFHEPKASENMA